MTDDPLFDLFSFGRRGRGDRLILSASEIAQISRTVGRTPEVVVKVLPRGTSSLGAVQVQDFPVEDRLISRVGDHLGAALAEPKATIVTRLFSCWQVFWL